MIAVFYVLMGVFFLCPIYTYVIYPIILFFLREKVYDMTEIEPVVSVLVVDNEKDMQKKLNNISKCLYPQDRIEVIQVHDINEDIIRAKGEILLITDALTEFDEQAIKRLVKPFSNNRIGAVVGEQRPRRKSDGSSNVSLFWRYENLVRRLESKIGCVSGANNTIFAVRKELVPQIDLNIINKSFYIATTIVEKGMDVVCAQDAYAYEESQGDNNVDKHIRDGAGYYQALGRFWRLCFFKKGSFVFVGHRVMKWLVPFCMFFFMIVSIAGAAISKILLVFFVLQVIAYIIILLSNKIHICSVVDKVLGMLRYFVLLNFAYLLGLVRLRDIQKS